MRIGLLHLAPCTMAAGNLKRCELGDSLAGFGPCCDFGIPGWGRPQSCEPLGPRIGGVSQVGDEVAVDLLQHVLSPRPGGAAGRVRSPCRRMGCVAEHGQIGERHEDAAQRCLPNTQPSRKFACGNADYSSPTRRHLARGTMPDSRRKVGAGGKTYPDRGTATVTACDQSGRMVRSTAI